MSVTAQNVANKLAEVAGIRVDLPIMGGFNDPSNTFSDDVVVTGGTQKARLKTPAINGAGAAPDTAACKRAWVIRLNESYVDGLDLEVALTVFNSRAIATHSKVDCEVYKLGTDGSLSGVDLCATAEQVITAVTAATEKVFSVTGSGLAKGDRLMVVGALNLNDTGAAGGSADAYGYLSRAQIGGSMRGGFACVER